MKDHGYIQAWTPVFFGVDSSIIVDLIKTPGQDFLVSLEGGIATEYILPTFSNGSFTQAIGQNLVRLNDNLNISLLFIRLNVNLD